ncbi:MAG: GMC family oxidoreductase, partial [Chloroflexi bacterium]
MHPSERFDFVVLGGGSAGCVLASRLSEDPSIRVCLVEAGPDYGAHQDGGWPADLLDASSDALESHDWGYEGGVASARARVIGGCSSINGC